MEIAPLSADRSRAAVTLWHEAGLTRPWNDPHADLERALAGPASTVLAGIEGDELVATAMVGHDGHRGCVYYLAVSPTCRRAGRGRAMMAACEAWLAERGIPKINLLVRGDNAPVRAFYERLGYGRDDVVVLARRLG